MRRLSLFLSLGAVAAAVLFVVPAFAAHGAPVSAAGGGTTTCNGDLAPGTYHRVVVPQDAVCMGAGPVTIRGGLFVEQGATLVLGSEDQPVHTATISGGVHGTNAASVQIHFSTIDGGIDVHGGSGPFGGPFDITWNTIEDSHINGRVLIEGYNGFWMGFIRNEVNGSVSLNHNVLVDPDGNEYVSNTMHGSLYCVGNSPDPQLGDSEGAKNHVTGTKNGQCADL